MCAVAKTKIALLILTSAFFLQSAVAQISSAAAAVANDFNVKFDNNQINKIYDSHVGDFVRSKMTRDSSVSQLSVMRSSLGGGASSRSVITQQSSTDPSTGAKVVAIRYQAVFPIGKVYEDLSLVEEKPGVWKLYGVFFNPVPVE
ncbi:DUF4019 domain-containing protein [Caballeronia jiangsuensis]|uniref:DUF4019 domain-containing protein n=1 Tax=Caballeronia jiangsuensis TaxID=1458357 RepID=UPI0038B6B429